MCPSCKLEYFRTVLNWDAEQINEVQLLVISRFDESYAPPPSSQSMPQGPAQVSPSSSLTLDRFRRPSGTLTPSSWGRDDIRSYLEAPLTDRQDVIQYWNEHLKDTPYLAKYGLSFCSCPGEYSFKCFRQILIQL